MSCAGAVTQQQQLLQLRDHQGNTALHLAAVEGLPESVQLLLQAGAPINLQGKCAGPSMHAPEHLVIVVCQNMYFGRRHALAQQHDVACAGASRRF